MHERRSNRLHRALWSSSPAERLQLRRSEDGRDTSRGIAIDSRPRSREQPLNLIRVGRMLFKLPDFQ
jgi:hypothetical protein